MFGYLLKFQNTFRFGGWFTQKRYTATTLSSYAEHENRVMTNDRKNVCLSFYSYLFAWETKTLCEISIGHKYLNKDDIKFCIIMVIRSY